MSWKFVFNSTLGGYRLPNDAKEAALKTGYLFFMWNDQVYDLNCDKIGITIDDLY